jgi:hypothetical protein
MSYFPTSESPPARREEVEQEPLGAHPSYDEILDVAVQYTFPCSDPIACDTCCAGAERRREREAGAPFGPGPGTGPEAPVER